MNEKNGTRVLIIFLIFVIFGALAWAIVQNLLDSLDMTTKHTIVALFAGVFIASMVYVPIILIQHRAGNARVASLEGKLEHHQKVIAAQADQHTRLQMGAFLTHQMGIQKLVQNSTGYDVAQEPQPYIPPLRLNGSRGDEQRWDME